MIVRKQYATAMGPMSEELKAIKEGAKAVQEASKAGKAMVDATSNVGTWIANILGTAPADLVGLMFGDYLRELRIRNMDRIRRRTEEILDARGVEKPKQIGPKLALPAFEAASEETDEVLQDLWARLLANAMDPNRDIHLQRILVDTLKQFEPIDALVFESVSSLGQRQCNAEGIVQARSGRSRPSFIQVSLDRLEKLDCIGRSPRERFYKLKALGEELRYAISGSG